MKLLPFTEECRQKLLQQGYTHACLLRTIPASEREYFTEKNYRLYEALKHPAGSSGVYNEMISNEISAAVIDDYLDCYIMIKN